MQFSHLTNIQMAPVAVSSERRSSTLSPVFKPSQSWRPTEVLNLPTRTSCTFDSVESALEAFAAGEFVVVMDDESRENEGDLIISASQCTPEKMAWMIKHTRSVHFASLGVINSASTYPALPFY